MPWMTRPTMSSSSVLAAPSDERPDDEDHEPAQEQASGAPDVGQAARERHRDDVCEQVAVDDPRGAAELGEGGLAGPIGVGDDEIVDDRRQGDGRDHQLEAGQEDTGAEDGQQRVCRAPGHRRSVHGLPLRGRASPGSIISGMSAEVLASTEEKMKRTLEAMERDFQRVRTGGASASLIDAIQVDHLGQRARLIELATVTIPDPRQIVIRPWDPKSLRSIGTAISQSRIGLTPTIDGSTIRLYVPALSEERRRELVGLVHKRMDQARVEIRAVRHEALAALRARDPKKLVGSDDVRRETALLQRMTDGYVAEIDRLGQLKEESVFRL